VSASIAVGMAERRVLVMNTVCRSHSARTRNFVMRVAPTAKLGLMKIAYCNAVMKYGLDGFRPLATRDIILGRYPNIAVFVGSDLNTPPPPYPRGRQHSVSLGSITYTHTRFLTATIRLFGDSGAGDKGMPFYTVIYGSEVKHRVVERERMPRPARKILL